MNVTQALNMNDRYQAPTQTQSATLTRTRTNVKVLAGILFLTGASFAAAGALLMTPAVLTLQTTAMRGSSLPMFSTVMKGASDVPFLGIALSARNKDITVTQLTLTSGGEDDGSFSTNQNDVTVLDHLQSCSLYDQATNALLGGPRPIDAAGHVVFSGISIVVTTTTPVLAEVHCDVANVVGESGTADAFAMSIQADTDVLAETTNTGNVVQGARLHLGGLNDLGLNRLGRQASVLVKDSGTLDIGIDNATPASDIILGNSTDVIVGKWRITALDESMDIDTLTFRGTTNNNALTSVKVTGSDESGLTITQTGYLSNGVITFSNLGFFVPANDVRTILLSVNTNIVGINGVASGEAIGFILDPTAPGSLLAIGQTSGSSITTTDSGMVATANSMVIRKTKPMVVLSSLSPSGAAVPGMNEVLRFNVSATSKGELVLQRLMFRVQSSDNSNSNWNGCETLGLGNATKWDLYNLTRDPVTPLNGDVIGSGWNFYDSSGTTCANGQDVVYAVLDLGVGQAPVQYIGAGTTDTYSLKVDTTGASSGADDNFRLDIVGEWPNVGTNAFQWDDEETTDPNFIGGLYIDNLPINGGTLVY